MTDAIAGDAAAAVAIETERAVLAGDERSLAAAARGVAGPHANPGLLSAVVPAYNEVESIRLMNDELVRALEATGAPFEILYVDDGSTDGTQSVLAALQAEDPRVRVILSRRNRGKSAAYMAGFAECRGETILTLDADLQDDPAEIPKLLEALEADADLVVGWKLHRMGNEPLKTVPSRVFNGIKARAFGLGLHDSNCGFRAMRREVAESFVLYGDLYRFIPELAHMGGFRVAEVGVLHRKRRFGTSKYGPRRFWTGLLDLLTVIFLSAYAQRPLHFFGTAGLVPFAAGVGLELYVLSLKLMGGTFSQHLAALIIGVLLIVVGFQCILTGLIGEMLSSNHRHRMRALARADASGAAVDRVSSPSHSNPPSISTRSAGEER